MGDWGFVDPEKPRGKRALIRPSQSRISGLTGEGEEASSRDGCPHRVVHYRPYTGAVVSVMLKVVKGDITTLFQLLLFRK